MRVIKIRTKRFSRYEAKRIQTGHLTGDYAGSGENIKGLVTYDPSYDSREQRTATGGIKTGYRSKSLKEGV